MTIRVLRIVPGFLPRESMYGHYVTFFMISKAQTESGLSVRVLSTGERNAHELVDGIDVTYMEHDPKFLSYFKLQKRLRNRIESFRNEIDVLHSHGRIALTLDNTATGIPHVVHLHDTPFTLEQPLSHKVRNFGSLLYDFRKKLLFQRYLKRSSAVIAYSKYVQRYAITNYGVPKKKVEVVYNGISHNFSPSSRPMPRDAVGISEGPEIILYVGRLKAIRGIDTVLAAFSILRKTRPNVHLLIIGSASAEKEHWLNEQERNFHLDGTVTRIHHVSYEELPSYYRMADIHVAVGNYMGFPKTIIESLACGTPIIAKENEDTLSIVENPDLLIRSPDPQHLAFTIEKVLMDVKMKEDVLNRGPYIGNKYSWRATSSRINSIYQKILV